MITLDAIIRPATEGTKEMEPGAGLFFPSFCISILFSLGFSGDQTTLSFFIPLFFKNTTPNYKNKKENLGVQSLFYTVLAIFAY